MKLCDMSACQRPAWPGGTACWVHRWDRHGETDRAATWEAIDEAFHACTSPRGLAAAVREAAGETMNQSDARTAVNLLRDSDRAQIESLPLRWEGQAGRQGMDTWRVEVVNDKGEALAYRIIGVDEEGGRGAFFDAGTLPRWRRLGTAMRLALAVFDQFPHLEVWSVSTPTPDGVAFWNTMERRGVLRVTTRQSNARWVLERH